MEGTRNEKAMIVIASYVIGFTTAYIAFGIATETIEEFVAIETPATPPSVLVADTSADPVLAGEVAGAQAQFEITEEGLIVYAASGPTLVSVNAAGLTDEERASLEGQGMHVALGNVVASESGSFIYFCEQSVIDGPCVPYVFDTTSETIHPVTLSGADPYLVSWTGDLLSSPTGPLSTDPSRPWFVAL